MPKSCLWLFGVGNSIVYGRIYPYFFSIPGCIKVVFLLWNRNEKTIGTSAWEIDDLVFRDLSNDLEQTLSFF